jgi:4'-phosphopantetheinyl transferase
MQSGIVPIRENAETFAFERLSSAAHVWDVTLSVSPTELTRLRHLLAPHEEARADRFQFACDQHRFIVARSRLRQILARYLDVTAEDIRFVYGPQGKPVLANSSVPTTLHFNLSHCDDRALIAISFGRSVGVDLERTRVELAGREIVRHCFSIREQVDLHELPAALWTEGFFKCWTSKEAYLKGIGDGLHIPLDAFDVSVDPKRPAKLLRPVEGREGSAGWSLHDVDVGAGYVGALALSSSVTSIRIVRY